MKNNLEEGRIVKVGQVLVQYNSESSKTEIASLKTQLMDLQSQKAQLAILQESLTKGENKFSKSDTYGFYQIFENYEAQVKSLTANINKVNQSVDDQNRIVTNEQAEIQSQIENLNTRISDYTALENSLDTGEKISTTNLYYGQYSSYQSQVAMIKDSVTNGVQAKKVAEQSDMNSQFAELKGNFLSNISANLSTLQNQKQSLKIEMSSLSKNNSYDHSLDSQLISLKAQALASSNKQMTDLESSISQLNTKLDLQQQENQYNVVLSPDDGVLHFAANILGAKQVSSGSVLAEIYPTLKARSKVNLTVYVPSTEISGIKLGQTLRFTVQQNLPKTEILVGKINHIDNVPTEMKTINAYKITAQVAIKANEVDKIRYGLAGKSVVVIGKKTYFEYYWDKIKGNE